MLKRLSVQNFALLEKLELEFVDGLNVLTGETGAGKSLIINALNSILGEKVSINLLRTGSPKAIVEGVFEDFSPEVSKILEEMEIDAYEDELILRREINRSGRSRAFVNDSVVHQDMIKRVSDIVVDLHGQHEHQSLLRSENHIAYLDAFAGLEKSVLDVTEKFRKIKAMQKEWDSLSRRGAELKQQEEFIKFQINEIASLELVPDEEDELTKEEKILSNFERISELCNEIYSSLYEQPDSAYAKLGAALEGVEELENIDGEFKGAVQMLESAYAAIEEVARAANDFVTGKEYDPHRLEEIRIRLDQINRLKKKFGLPLEGILEKLSTLRQEIDRMENLDDDLHRMEEEIEEKKKEIAGQCSKLSEERHQAALGLETSIMDVLHRIGMKDGRMRAGMSAFEDDDASAIQLAGGGIIRQDGMDRVEFMASTNPGEDFKPLTRIASGGELSRITLAIKSVLAGKDQINVLVFDEIDIGISGRVAESVGRELKNLSRTHQVICVTHLPQIASFADKHFSVRKKVMNGQTFTFVDELDREARIVEIAGLLGGEKMTEPALRNAEEMISANSS